jgi:hypothetical protein
MTIGFGINSAESLAPTQYAREGGLSRFGLPELPVRAPPNHLRKRVTVERAKREIEQHGSDAIKQARERLAVLTQAGASPDQLRQAQAIVDFLRHSRGPKFQVAMLIHCGYPKVEFIFARDQTAYERVYELSVGIARGIYAQGAISIRKAMAALETRIGSQPQIAQWHALADLFLSNSPAQNEAHPQLKAMQELLDGYALEILRSSGGDPRAAELGLDQAREDIAQRIRAGDIDLISDV